MKGDRFHTIVGNPFELDARSTSNALSNRKKGTKLKVVGAAAVVVGEAAGDKGGNKGKKRSRSEAEDYDEPAAQPAPHSRPSKAPRINY
jgi:hypothetical protein